MKTYYYINDTNVIRLKSKFKPTRKNILNFKYWRGTWVIKEFTNEHGWIIPCFPEVTIETLEKMTYIGSVKTD